MLHSSPSHTTSKDSHKGGIPNRPQSYALVEEHTNLVRSCNTFRTHAKLPQGVASPPVLKGRAACSGRKLRILLGPAPVNLAKEAPGRSLACPQLCGDLLTYRRIIAACCLVSLRFAVAGGWGKLMELMNAAEERVSDLRPG